jgi:hypothetical protein
VETIGVRRGIGFNQEMIFPVCRDFEIPQTGGIEAFQKPLRVVVLGFMRRFAGYFNKGFLQEKIAFHSSQPKNVGWGIAGMELVTVQGLLLVSP